MNMRGYYSLRDDNNNNGTGSWPSLVENKNPGLYHDLFLRRQMMDNGHHKEDSRQRILNHESTIQLQRDLIIEPRSKDPHKLFIGAGTSQSTPLSSGFLSEDKKNGRCPSKSPLVYPNRSALGAAGAYPQFSSINGSILQPGCSSTENTPNFKGVESLDIKCKKLQIRLFDLELPDDQYLSDKHHGEGVSRRSGANIHPFDQNHDLTHDKRPGTLSYRDGDASSSNLYSRIPKCLIDLNEEPIRAEEAPSSARIDIHSDITWSKHGIQKRDLSSSSQSGFPFISKESSRETSHGRDGGLTNMHQGTEWRQRGWLSNKFESGQTGSNGSSFCGSFHTDDTHTYRTSKLESGKARDITIETLKKRKIFGVELPEKETPFHQSSVIKSGSSRVSSLENSQRTLNQNLIVLEGKACNQTFSRSKNRSWMPNSEVIQEKNSGLVSSNLWSDRSLPVESSNQTNPYSQLEFNESKDVMNNSGCALDPFGRRCITGKTRDFDYMMNAKSAQEINHSTTAPKDYLYEVGPPQPDFASGDKLRKRDNSCGIIPWLNAGHAKSSGEMDCYSRMNYGSLQNVSKQSISILEKQKGQSERFVQDSLSVASVTDEVGGSLGYKKIFGFPSFGKNPQASNDLASSTLPSDTNTRQAKLLITDLNLEPLSPRSEEPCEFEVSVRVDGLNNRTTDSRHLIDLNMCAEEETEEILSSRKTNYWPGQIDLEVSIFEDDTELDDISTQGGNSTQPHEGLVDAAAAALVSISVSNTVILNGKTHCPESKASHCDSLNWFADVISSLKDDIDVDENPQPVLINTKFDYFEFMTLKLTKPKVEEFNPEPCVFENPKDEDNAKRRPPRRGQGRRGRHRKDFQRDILPNLISLSRNEVTEDLQAFEGLIRADGGSWQSSLTLRNATKSKRGRKRLVGGGGGGSNVASPTEALVPPPAIQQPCGREANLDERRLTGWGKKTRRPPRQRYVLDGSLIPS